MKSAQQWVKISNKYWLISIIILIGAFYRITSFGDPTLSIGTIDTGVYVEASEKSIFSWDFYTSGRPITVPLIYKLLSPQDGYSLEIVSEPAIQGTVRDLHYQSDFKSVVVFQMVMSIIGWSFLALVFYCILHNPLIKVTSAILVVLFAYSPQLSEWDRILFSESLSFSLFAILLGISLIIIQKITREGKKISNATYIGIGVWFIVFCLWIFTRDTNAYLTLLIIPILLFLIIHPRFRSQLPFCPLLIVIISLVSLFIFQQRTMHESGRWILPFQSNLIYRIFPYPDRVEYFKKLGMPVDDRLLSFTDLFKGPEYMNQSLEFSYWTYHHGTSSWMRFLVDYPLWSAQELYYDLENLFYENLQPWYTGPDGNRPLDLILLGDYLHQKSHSIIPIIFILTILLFVIAYKNNDQENINLALFMMWLFVGELFLLYISFFGDPRSIIRHALVAVVPLRLSIWLLLMMAFDFSLSSKSISGFRDENILK